MTNPQDSSATRDDPGATASKARAWRFPRFNEDQLFLLLSLLIGALAGLTVVAFIVLTERLGMRIYPVGSPGWRRVAVPVGGSLLMGFLLFRYFPDARGSGVPQTKAALYAREGYISLRTVVGKFFCTATTLACGIPLGREGPSVQVGAGIASVLGRRLGLSPQKVKALIPVGAAAAVAAAFNTPMAAVLFALEEVVGDLNAPVLGSVVLASATSWAVLRMLLGNHPLFEAPAYELVHPLEFGVYAVLGIAGGFLSVAFTRLLLVMRARFQRLPRQTRWWHPVAGGITVGLMGWFVPQVLGVGYSYVGEALHGSMALKLMLLLIALKLVAITVSYASGNAGGIFGPSLFLGAMLGGVVGTLAHRLLPGYTAAPGAYALVGMGALFAGIVRAPMTSVLMIFEMTRDYTVIVPLMIANLVSLFIARRLQHEPIYEALSLQDGIHLPSPHTREEVRGRSVQDLLRPAPETLRITDTVLSAMQQTATSSYRSWVVMDGELISGVLTRMDLQQAVAEGRGDTELRQLCDLAEFPHMHPDQTLPLALERMSRTRVDVLPVVNRAAIQQLEGVVLLSDILAAYNADAQDGA